MKVKWGIIGAGNIAVRFTKSLSHEENAELIAVSCRTQEKADRFANDFHVKKAYAGFDKIIADAEIDAVYIALPHRYHYEWILKALQAGKAVLCEKPACLNKEEMEGVQQCALQHNVLFMEAMKTRLTPLYQRVKEIIQSGEIGDIQSVQTCLCSAIDFSILPPSYHTESIGGGALLDEGIYCASWLEEYLYGDFQLDHIYASIKDGVDYYTEAVLSFGNDTAILECAFDRKKEKETVITGSKKTIRIYEMHRPERADIISEDGSIESLYLPYIQDDFYGQIHHFNTLFLEGMKESDRMPIAASIRCSSILDTIRQGYSYNDNTLVLLEQQEKELIFSSFDSHDVLFLGNQLVKNASKEDREISIQIIRESDQVPVFQYLMDSKGISNIHYMEGKRNLALAIHHSSFYAYAAHTLHQSYQEQYSHPEQYCFSGGAYPIYIHDQWTYTVCVSGLHEGKDHALIIHTLYEMLGKEEPSFPYILV